MHEGAPNRSPRWLRAVVNLHEKVLSCRPRMEGGEGDLASFDTPASPGVMGVVVLLTGTFAIGD